MCEREEEGGGREGEKREGERGGERGGEGGVVRVKGNIMERERRWERYIEGKTCFPCVKRDFFVSFTFLFYSIFHNPLYGTFVSCLLKVFEVFRESLSLYIIVQGETVGFLRVHVEWINLQEDQ